MRRKVFTFIRSHVIDILIVIILAIFAYSALASYLQTVKDSRIHKTEVVAVFSGISNSNLPAVGDTLYLPDGSIFGTVTDVKVEDAKKLMFISDDKGSGEYMYVQTKGKDVTVKVEVGVIKKNGSFVIGSEKLLIGTERKLHTEVFFGNASITNITLKEERTDSDAE